MARSTMTATTMSDDFGAMHRGELTTLSPDVEARYDARLRSVAREHARTGTVLAIDVSLAPSAPTTPHSTYLGASDLGAILGLDPFRTPLDVWAEKTGRTVNGESDEADAGNDHEAGVIAGAVRKLRRRGVLVSHEYPGPGTIVSDRMIGPRFERWRGSTLDSVLVHREHGECALEAKLVGAGMAHLWGPEPAGAAAIPERVLSQVHWQTLHLREARGVRAPVAYVAADICGTDRRLYEVAIDDDMVAELLEAGRTWWLRHVIGDDMPVPTARDIATLARVFPRAEKPLSPFAPYDVRELAEEYAIASEYARRVQEERDRLGAKLRAMLGDAAGYRWDGGQVTWKENVAGDRSLRVWIREDRKR